MEIQTFKAFKVWIKHGNAMKCPIWSRWTIYSGRFYLRSQVLLGDFHHVTTTATTHRRNAFGASSKPGRACATLLTKVLCPGNFARVRLMMMMMMMMMMIMISRGNSCYAKHHLLFIFTFHCFQWNHSNSFGSCHKESAAGPSKMKGLIASWASNHSSKSSIW